MVNSPITLNGKMYSLRVYNHWFIISNSEKRDVFYFNTEATYQNFPEQLSIQSFRSNSEHLMHYLLQINSLILNDFPSKWIRRRVIHLFKKLVDLFGEDNLLHPTMLNVNNRLCFSCFNFFKSMYEQFNNLYPLSLPENTPFKEGSLMLHFLISRETYVSPQEHYTLSSKVELEAELCTLDLQLAYVDVYSNEMIIYKDTFVNPSDSENYEMVKKVFLVFNQNNAVLCFATPYKAVYKSELTSN